MGCPSIVAVQPGKLYVFNRTSLNEAETLEVCIAKARRALGELNIAGEIIVADNGSTDGSPDIAARMGARVVSVEAKGYGNALIGGISAARGDFIIMGDAR